MTEQELSRKLAERFEPHPVCVSMDIFSVSTGGWWIWKDRLGLTSEGYGHFEPRSYREPDRVVWMIEKVASHDRAHSPDDRILHEGFFLTSDWIDALAKAVEGEAG